MPSPPLAAPQRHLEPATPSKVILRGQIDAGPCRFSSAVVCHADILAPRPMVNAMREANKSAPIHIIGGGLAGSEAAWQAAGLGVAVVLHEMRPVRGTDA